MNEQINGLMDRSIDGVDEITDRVGRVGRVSRVGRVRWVGRMGRMGRRVDELTDRHVFGSWLHGTKT